jgi:hypothetical protein
MFFVKRGRCSAGNIRSPWLVRNQSRSDLYMAAQTQHVLLGPRCEINNLARVISSSSPA